MYYLSYLPLNAVNIMTRSQDASIVDEAQKLISDGLDWKLFFVLQENLSSNFPENMVNYALYWCSGLRLSIATQDVVIRSAEQVCACMGLKRLDNLTSL